MKSTLKKVLFAVSIASFAACSVQSQASMVEKGDGVLDYTVTDALKGFNKKCLPLLKAGKQIAGEDKSFCFHKLFKDYSLYCIESEKYGSADKCEQFNQKNDGLDKLYEKVSKYVNPPTSAILKGLNFNVKKYYALLDFVDKIIDFYDARKNRGNDLITHCPKLYQAVCRDYSGVRARRGFLCENAEIKETMTNFCTHKEIKGYYGMKAPGIKMTFEEGMFNDEIFNDEIFKGSDADPLLFQAGVKSDRAIQQLRRDEAMEGYGKLIDLSEVLSLSEQGFKEQTYPLSLNLRNYYFEKSHCARYGNSKDDAFSPLLKSEFLEKFDSTKEDNILKRCSKVIEREDDINKLSQNEKDEIKKQNEKSIAKYNKLHGDN